MRDNVSPLNSY